MPRDRGPFRTGERVLVPHTDKYYEAKILKSEKRNDGLWYYRIHYNGWNKMWDEWVEQTGLTKFKKELVAIEFKAEGDGGDGEPGGAAAAATTDAGGRAGGKKRKAEDLEAHANGTVTPAQVRVALPAALKQVLLDDWERVKGGGVAPLPRRPSVATLLQQYVDSCRTSRELVEPEEEVANGLRIYFDKALPHMLLYPEEQEQCKKALLDGSTPASLYGGEHLLRLLTRLPELLPTAQMSGDEQASLEARLSAFTAFLKQNAGQAFQAAGLPDEHATS